MKLILGDNVIEWSIPYPIARQIIDQLRQDDKNKVSKNETLKNAIDFIQNSDWYKALNPIEQDIINRKNLKLLLTNGLKNEAAKPKKMKIEIDRILELIKIILLTIIVILLFLNFYSDGSGTKYELYDNGNILLNKETGDIFEYKKINDDWEYVKSKVKN